MGPTIAGTVYGAVGVIAAFILRPRFADNPSVMRAAIFWLITTPVLFLVPQTLPALIVCGILLALLTPKDIDDRAAFYIMTLVAVPVTVAGAIPFPGINYLMIVDFAEIACVVLLVPAILFLKTPNAARFAPTAGIMIMILTILFSIQEFRSANLTSGLRASLENVLLYALPYMALIRLMPATASYDKIFATFVFIGVVFFFSALVSQVTRWNFYTFIMERHGFLSFADFRYGFLRVSVTVIPVLVGFIMTLALISLEYFRALKRCGFLMTWVYRGMFVATTVLTVSRGAWLAMAVGVLTFFFFAKGPRSLRPALISLALLIGMPTALYLTMTSDLSAIDEYGTFEYRKELLRVSLEQVWANPLFGDPYYVESGRFDHLDRGDGLVDVVNYYIQILLEHGMVGFAFYAIAFTAMIMGLLSVGKFVHGAGDKTLELQRAVLLASVAAYLVTMATVSDVSLAVHLGVIMLALSTAFVAAARVEYKKPAAIRETGDLAAEDGVEGRVYG